jgi:hypothetical protein
VVRTVRRTHLFEPQLTHRTHYTFRERGARALEERLSAKAGAATKAKDADVEAGAE